MMELAEFTAEDGTAVIFEVAGDEVVRGTAPASRRGDALVVETGKRLEQVVEVVRPAVGVLSTPAVDRYLAGQGR